MTSGVRICAEQPTASQFCVNSWIKTRKFSQLNHNSRRESIENFNVNRTVSNNVLLKWKRAVICSIQLASRIDVARQGHKFSKTGEKAREKMGHKSHALRFATNGKSNLACGRSCCWVRRVNLRRNKRRPPLLYCERGTRGTWQKKRGGRKLCDDASIDIYIYNLRWSGFV